MNPIGHFRCTQIHPYEASRQGSVQHAGDEAEGYIELSPGHNFEQALDGVEEFSHLWILFLFHHNSQWKPKVLPPRGSDKKVGVFATRSPYRPNPIGISCVKFKKREGLKIYVSDFDILDGSPVLDIKPYLAYADSFPEANEGWIKSRRYEIKISEEAQEQLQFLHENQVQEISHFLHNQLQEEPTNARKKRILSPSQSLLESCLNEGTDFENFHILAYRTWRILFHVIENWVEVKKIFSGYSAQELLASEDPYKDKESHRSFILKFGQF